MAQEVTVTTDGQSAEYETGGIVTNIVPKAGGNVFSLYSNASYADKNFQTRELASGLTYGASVGSLTSLTAYGGPNQSSHGLGRFAVSYVTGSHAVKVGATMMSGVYDVYGA